MSGNRIGFMVLTYTETDAMARTLVKYELCGSRAAAENECGRQQAHAAVDAKFGKSPPWRYSYEVAELVTCDPEAGGKP